MTGNDIKNKVLALIDNYTEDGVEVAQEDIIDVENKIIVFIDMHQKEIWRLNRNTKQVEITYKQPENRLGNLGNLELVDFECNTQYYPDEDGVDDVQGYSIQVNAEASDNATLTYQEEIGGTWTDLVAISPTGITTHTTYKGVLSVSSTSNKVRLKVEGSEHFLHQNRALWKFKYKTNSVPTYQPWVKYDLPSDFNAIDMVVEEYNEGVYAQSNNYKLENFKDFYHAFNFDGRIRITYHPVPADYTALTQELQLDDTLAMNLVYDITAKLGFYENPDLVNWAEGRRLEHKQDASTSKAPSADEMDDYYS